MAELSGNILTDYSMLSGAISAQQDNMGGNIIPGMVIGIPGKSAYEYALSAGYTGTEIEFAEALAQIGKGSGNVDVATIERIVADYLKENPPVVSNEEIEQAVESYLVENPPPAGPQGPQGEQGPQGDPGASAYEIAQDGGYTGTAEEFATSLAGIMSMDLLWTNASPDSEFPPQTVTVNTDPYQFFYVECTHKDGSSIRTTAIMRYGLTVMMFGYNVSYFYRPVTPISTGIKFSQGYKYSGGSETKYDYACVPLRVYGIKGVN